MSFRSNGSILTGNIDPVVKLAYECGDLTHQAVEMVSKFADTWKLTGFDALLECRVVSESRIVDIIASRGAIEKCYLDSGHLSINRDVLAKVPFADARRLRSIPLAYEKDKNLLTCVIANPLDEAITDALAEISGCGIRALVAERTRIELKLGELYPTDLQVPLPNRGDAKNATSAG